MKKKVYGRMEFVRVKNRTVATGGGITISAMEVADIVGQYSEQGIVFRLSYPTLAGKRHIISELVEQLPITGIAM